MTVKIISILLILIGTFNVDAQTNDKLDEKNGIKDLKLGDLISKHKEKLSPISGTEDEYYYSSEENSLFGWEWEQCNVSYKENRLVAIGIFWKDKKGLFEALVRDLTKLFGVPLEETNTIQIPKQEGISFHFWEGEKLLMIIGKDNSEKHELPCESCKVSLILMSKGLTDNKVLDDDF